MNCKKLGGGDVIVLGLGLVLGLFFDIFMQRVDQMIPPITHTL